MTWDRAPASPVWRTAFKGQLWGHLYSLKGVSCKDTVQEAGEVTLALEVQEVGGRLDGHFGGGTKNQRMVLRALGAFWSRGHVAKCPGPDTGWRGGGVPAVS